MYWSLYIHNTVYTVTITVTHSHKCHCRVDTTTGTQARTILPDANAWKSSQRPTWRIWFTNPLLEDINGNWVTLKSLVICFVYNWTGVEPFHSNRLSVNARTRESDYFGLYYIYVCVWSFRWLRAELQEPGSFGQITGCGLWRNNHLRLSKTCCYDHFNHDQRIVQGRVEILQHEWTTRNWLKHCMTYNLRFLIIYINFEIKSGTIVLINYYPFLLLVRQHTCCLVQYPAVVAVA